MKSSGERDIFTAWVAAIVSATLTLVATVFLLFSDSNVVPGFGLANAALIYFLAYWVARNSRIAIVALITHLAAVKIYAYWSTGSISAFVGLAIFGYFYIVGAIAIFDHHRPRQHEA